MTRGGASKERGEPERRCIVTRECRPKNGLIRFVVGPDDQIVPDLGGRLPGRGIWVSAEAAALQQASAKGHFARAAKRAVRVPEDLAVLVEHQLADRLVGLMGMARKAGRAVAGREKTRTALQEGAAAVLLQAQDGSPRERAELRAPAGTDAAFSCLSGREMGMAFGRDRVIHAAVLAGGLADRVRDEALRLSAMRGQSGRQLSGRGADQGVAGDRSRGKG